MINLITGGNGFVGSHLIEHLLAQSPSDAIHSLDRESVAKPPVIGHHCDLRDADGVRRVIDEVRPDRIYHLAGFARASGEKGVPENFENNTLTTLALLDTIAALDKPVTLFLASSAHVYGNQVNPVDEESPTLPVSPYGFSKMLAERAAQRATEQCPRLHVVVGRLSNCIGPGQGPGFVVADFAHRLHELLANGGTQLETGPLDARRSFMDVRDLVTLLPRLLDGPQASRFEIYNLASPDSHTIREMVEQLIALTGKPISLKVKTETAPNAFAGLVVKTDKLQHLLHPSFRALGETLKDTLENEMRGSSK